jgi:hypothetical protein
MTFFKGLEELNQFIEAGVIPQGARVRPSILNGVRPIADSDGRPLEYSDFVLLYHGLRPTPGPPGLHLTCLIEERNLGRTLLAALESCGRSPLDLEVAMLAIPGDTTSLRRAVSGLEQPAIQDLVDWMPDLRHALYQVTGREFSEAELLDICENLDKVTVA